MYDMIPHCFQCVIEISHHKCYSCHDGNRSVDTVFIALAMEIVLWIQFLYLSRWKSFCGYSFYTSHDGNHSVDTVFISLTMEIVLWIQFLYLSRWKSFCG